MQFERIKCPYFNDFVIVNKNGWDLTTISRFPHIRELSADTETKLRDNNDNIVDDKALYEFLHEHKQDKHFKANEWLKQNIKVDCYALTISDGNNFALFQNVNDFLIACGMFKCKYVFWYNARFDFAIFDYYFLTNGWKDASFLKDGTRQHLPSHTFENLVGDFGQRYSMQVWIDCLDNSRHKHTSNFKMLDICNIYGGGLDKNLHDWNITEDDGTPLWKLKMDYQAASLDNENDLMYMRNDVVGLHRLAIKIDAEIEKLTTFSLFKGDYITAGGLAKKTLLFHLFGKSNKKNVEYFKKAFYMTKELDEFYRAYHLYKGGIAIVNPDKIGVVQHNIHKYDSNSMYPDKMFRMLYPYGKARHIEFNGKKFKVKEKCVYVLRIKNFNGALKENMIPVYQLSTTGKYENFFREPDDILIWYEELEQLKVYYDIDYQLVDVFEFDGVFPKGAKTYVDKFYQIKNTTKGAVKQGAKLLLNSSYGKLAERVERVKCKVELNVDGIVHIKQEGIEVDENSMLSVLVGSRITMLARVDLMKHILLYTKNNPKLYFCYADTDSISTLLNCEYDIDDKELGKYKCEGIFKNGLYLAPKTYLLSNGKDDYEVHCKGVNTKVVKAEIIGQEWSNAIKVFRGKRYFKTLCALNVKGGKALVWVDKMIVNKDIPILNDEDFEIFGDDINNIY